MGVSTDAYLWFGYSHEEEGLPEPVIEKVKAYRPDDNPEDDPEGALEDLLKPFGVELVRHCHTESPMFGLGIKLGLAHRGYPVQVKLDEACATHGIERARCGCATDVERVKLAAYAISWPTNDVEPALWLASYWS